MSNEELLLLKNKFLAWTVKWATTVNDNIEEIQFGLPDIVNILQALGFQIRDTDSCDPQEITVLKNDKKGMRIILTCLYSGQRYYLEKAIEKDPEIESSDNAICNSKHAEPCESFEEKPSFKDDRCASSERVTWSQTSNDSLNIKDNGPLKEFYTSVKKVNSDLTIAISRLEKVDLSKLSKKTSTKSIPNFGRQQSLRQTRSSKPSTSQNPQLSTRTKSSPNLHKSNTFVKTQKSKLLSVKKPEMTKSKSNEDMKKTHQSTEVQSKTPLTSKLYAHVKSTIPKVTPLKRQK